MAGLYELFETDPNLENDGIWVDYGEFRVKVAYAGAQNKNFSKYAEAKLKPYRRAMDAGTLSPDLSRSLMVDIYSHAVIRGWETKVGDVFVDGIESKTGDIIPFNVKNVLETLTALPALFLDIQEMAGKIANFRAAELADEAGN